MMRLLFVLLCCALSIISCGNKKNQWSVLSPDGKVTLTVEKTAQNDSLFYTVRFNGRTVVEPSPLGIVRNDEAFVTGLKPAGSSEVVRIDESYELVHGKKRSVHYIANEKVVSFISTNGRKLDLVLRASDDGVAFRYVFPDRDDATYTIVSEETGFHLPENSEAYIAPHDDAGKYTPAYETYYLNGGALDTPCPKKAGWSFPGLFKIDSGAAWVLITEAGLDRSYCGSHLKPLVENNTYLVDFPEEDEGLGVGEVEPASTLPWKTPWRVIMVGDSPGVMVESTLVQDLSAPSKMNNIDWVKPGRVSWSWWSDNDSPRDKAKLKKFIDLAADLGWEYSLIDANWNEMGDKVIEELVDYGKSKNVGILLWYNSGGPHNEVTEAPRDRMNERERRRKELKWLKDLGVKGIKVDFFQSDKQDRITQYLDILQDAADFEIMVNYHGCTIPRGWSRTYPNLMSMEGVRGAECYIFDPQYPDYAPWANTILPFTRNAVGPMDYTPVAFSDNRYPHKTTYAHELALSVIFESGWIHFADRVEAYRSLPPQVRDLLKELPVVWDETRYVAGEPGKFVAIARRHGDSWYVAAINGQEQEMTIRPDLAFAADKVKSSLVIADGKSPRQFSISPLNPEKVKTTEFQLQPFGGCLIKLDLQK